MLSAGRQVKILCLRKKVEISDLRRTHVTDDCTYRTSEFLDGSGFPMDEEHYSTRFS